MITAVDTNILLDILGNDPSYYEQSAGLIEGSSAQGMLIICPLVYSELLPFFIKKHANNRDAIKKLDLFLFEMGVHVINFSREDAQSAGSVWKRFLDENKNSVYCPSCGGENKPSCNKCQKVLKWRNHILTDFFIGAHAQNRAEVFLTRDHGLYKKYFTMKIISS